MNALVQTRQGRLRGDHVAGVYVFKGILFGAAALVLGLCLVVPTPAAAVGVWATNQSPRYLRWGGVRSASLEIDATFANPAGLVYLEPGLHFEIADQLLFTTRVIRDAEGDGRYAGAVHSYLFPTLSLALAEDRCWAVFVHAGPYGGALAAEFDDGIDALTAGVEGFGIEVSPFIAGVTLGAAVRLHDRLSIALGARYFYAKSEVLLSIPDARFASVAEGHGAGLVFSIDAEPARDLLLTLQLAWASPLDTENDTRESQGFTGFIGETFFPDGAKNRVTLPALLVFGASYRPLPRLTLALDVVAYLEGLNDRGRVKDQAKPAYGDEVSDHYHTGVEVGLGAGYALVPERLEVSLGVMYGHQGQEQAIRDALSYYPDYLQVGTGLTWSPADWLDVTAAYMVVFPEQGLESFDGAQTFHDLPVHFAGLGLGFTVPLDDDPVGATARVVHGADPWLEICRRAATKAEPRERPKTDPTIPRDPVRVAR
jgi:hypothetical protein